MADQGWCGFVAIGMVEWWNVGMLEYQETHLRRITTTLLVIKKLGTWSSPVIAKTLM